MKENKELTTTENTAVEEVGTPGVAYGFEDTRSEDILIPRIKVIQALSPERLDGEATEGTIINSLTKEDVAGKRFIPIKQYYSNIWWNPDRNADERIFCRSLDGKIGIREEGSLACMNCKKNQFDNTKVGKDAQPLCTAFLNFLGFFEGSAMPVVLSFSKTNYNEGKKMLSIARSMRSSIWNYAYTVASKKITKDRNTWYILVPTMAGASSDAERKLAFEIYNSYEQASIHADYEDGNYTDNTTTDAATEAEI